VRHDGSAADEHGVEVHIDDAAKFFDGIFPSGIVAAGDAGVVAEDVNVAERGDGVFGGGSDGIGIGELDGLSVDSAVFGQRCPGFSGGLGIDIPKADAGAGLEESPGDSIADAAGAAGDNGVSIGKIDLVHGRKIEGGGPMTNPQISRNDQAATLKFGFGVLDLLGLWALGVGYFPMHHIIFTAAPDLEVARRLARGVIENRLAACANLVLGVESHYRWEGKVCKESEVLMVLKTTGEQLPALEEFILAEHPYDTPEFVVQTIEAGSARYLDWISECVGPVGNL